MSPDAFGDATENTENFEVFDENWESVLVFLACQTQWRKEIPAMSPNVLWHGFDYSGVAVVLKIRGHKGEKAKSIFSDLQIMEQAALPILNKPK